MDHNKHNLLLGLRAALLSVMGDCFHWFPLIKQILWGCLDISHKGGVLKLWFFSSAKNVRLGKFQFIFGFGGSAVAMHGHTFLGIPGYSDTVFRAVFPARWCDWEEADSSSRGQCGEGGSCCSAGMGAVTEKLEKSVERSLVQSSEWAVKEEWGKSYDHPVTSGLCGRQVTPIKTVQLVIGCDWAEIILTVLSYRCIKDPGT